MMSPARRAISRPGSPESALQGGSKASSARGNHLATRAQASSRSPMRGYHRDSQPPPAPVVAGRACAEVGDNRLVELHCCGW